MTIHQFHQALDDRHNNDVEAFQVLRDTFQVSEDDPTSNTWDVWS